MLTCLCLLSLLLHAPSDATGSSTHSSHSFLGNAVSEFGPGLGFSHAYIMENLLFRLNSDLILLARQRHPQHDVLPGAPVQVRLSCEAQTTGRVGKDPESIESAAKKGQARGGHRRRRGAGGPALHVVKHIHGRQRSYDDCGHHDAGVQRSS